jgi:hypothetical protein
MPRGMFLISWDAYTGGNVMFKYPDSLDVPENTIQQLQVSHNFVESMQYISTDIISTLSFFNSEKKVIIALVLNENEDKEDYVEILNGFNQIISNSESLDRPGFPTEMRTIYDLSHHVFKAKEQVMINLANQITQLKEDHEEYKMRLEYLLNNETDPEKKVLLAFFYEEELTYSELRERYSLSNEELDKYLSDLEEKKLIQKKENSDAYELIF